MCLLVPMQAEDQALGREGVLFICHSATFSLPDFLNHTDACFLYILVDGRLDSGPGRYRGVGVLGHGQ